MCVCVCVFLFVRVNVRVVSHIYVCMQVKYECTYIHKRIYTYKHIRMHKQSPRHDVPLPDPLSSPLARRRAQTGRGCLACCRSSHRQMSGRRRLPGPHPPAAARALSTRCDRRARRDASSLLASLASLRRKWFVANSNGSRCTTSPGESLASSTGWGADCSACFVRSSGAGLPEPQVLIVLTPVCCFTLRAVCPRSNRARIARAQHTHTHTCTHAHVRVHTHTHTYTHAHTHTHTHTHKHTHTHTCAHTHT